MNRRGFFTAAAVVPLLPLFGPASAAPSRPVWIGMDLASRGDRSAYYLAMCNAGVMSVEDVRCVENLP